MKHNLPSPTDKNIKIPQPNVQAVPFVEAKPYKKKISTDSKSSVTDGSQEDYQNYRRMKVTTSSWGKKEEKDTETKNDDSLNIIYDSSTAHLKNANNTIYDDEDPRTSSPEHLGIPAGPVRMPIQRKSSIKDNKITTVGNEESFDKKFSKDNEGRANAYTSDDSCVDSAPPSRVRHPPSNRRKITKSSAT